MLSRIIYNYNKTKKKTGGFWTAFFLMDIFCLFTQQNQMVDVNLAWKYFVFCFDPDYPKLCFVLFICKTLMGHRFESMDAVTYNILLNKTKKKKWRFLDCTFFF